ncbi:MAG: serine/threonine protein kinase [Polyangiales bacterium]|jgi:serine/threonine protein kinase
MRSAPEAPFSPSLSRLRLAKTLQDPCKCTLWDCTIAPVEALETGAMVADMEVIRLLGKGGFGHVYGVNAPGHANPLALKLMNLDVCSESMQRRFQREAEVIQRLESEFVPVIYDFGEQDDGSPFILMELLQGQTLGELLEAEGGTLPWRRVLALGLQACEALDVAHSVGILHRDLKPENFFVVGTADEEQLKILDFGVATFVSGHTDRHGALTQTSAIVGTPHYMSPEQIRSSTIGVEADIYMLGVVLYECLTGHRPFGGEFLGDLLGSVLSGQFRPISDHAPQTPRILTNAVQRAMSLEPERRFSSAVAFGGALRQGRAAISEIPPKPSVSLGGVDLEKATMALTKVAANANYVAPSSARLASQSASPRRIGLIATGAVIFVLLTSATTYLIATRELAPPAVRGTEPLVPEAPPEHEELEVVADTDEAFEKEALDAPVGVAAPTTEEPEQTVQVRPRRNPTPAREAVEEPSLEVVPPPLDPVPVVTTAPNGLINPFE